MDRLTKSLREKIGESLKAVHDAPPLEQVSTASLGALRSYAAGLHANDVIGDYRGAIDYFHDAIRQDSNFAMAYVQLAFSLQSLGGAARNAQANDALAAAFRLRDRLPERERYNVEGAYYYTVANDRTKAIPALRRAVELDSTNYDAANTLANALSTSRDYDGARKIFQARTRGRTKQRNPSRQPCGPVHHEGRHAAVDSVLSLMATRSASFPSGPARFDEHWNRREYDAAEQLARNKADSSSPRVALNAQDGLVGVAAARGRLREAERRFALVNEARARVSGDTVDPYFVAFVHAMVDGELRGDATRGIAALDAALRATPVASIPVDKEQSTLLALGYARLGAAGKARELLNQHEARIDALLAGRRRRSTCVFAV